MMVSPAAGVEVMTPTDEQTVQASVTTRRRLQFTVRGLPAPQGSKSFKGMSRAGKAILAESSKAVMPWRQDVVSAACDAIDNEPGFKPFAGPVHLIVEFYLPRPKGAPKTRRVVPDVMPDLSKLIRSTEDALKTAAVWRDDAQVVDITTRKRYATFGDEQIGHPWELPGIGAVVTVVELDHEDTWADMPLDIHAAARLPAPALPAGLSGLPSTSRASLDEWGAGSVLIPASATDSWARQLIGKLLKESAARARRLQEEGIGPSHAIAVFIEDGAIRLASPFGRPLTPLQHDVLQLAREAREADTEIVVVLAATVE